MASRSMSVANTCNLSDFLASLRCSCSTMAIEPLALRLRQRAEESIDGEVRHPFGAVAPQAQRAIDQREVVVGRDDVGAVRLHRHAVSGFVHAHARVALHQFRQHALVVGCEVLHQHVGHAGVLRRHRGEEGLEGRQAAGRRADAHHRERQGAGCGMGVAAPGVVGLRAVALAAWRGVDRCGGRDGVGAWRLGEARSARRTRRLRRLWGSLVTRGALRRVRSWYAAERQRAPCGALGVESDPTQFNGTFLPPSYLYSVIAGFFSSPSFSKPMLAVTPL
jgi:hypothetical protein